MPFSKNLLFRYSFNCLTDGGNYQLWDTSNNIPKVCPINDTHIIDSNNIEVIAKQFDTLLDINKVRIIQQMDDLTQEMFRVEYHRFDCPSNQITSYSFNYNFPVCLLNIKIISKELNDGDFFNSYAYIDSPVGYITSNIDIGDTVVNMNLNSINYIYRGMDLVITNGIDSFRCDEIKKIYTDRIELSHAITTPFLASSPTYLRAESHSVKDFYLNKEVPLVELGNSHTGGTTIKYPVKIKVDYHNLSSNIDKNFNFIIEYLY